LLLNPDAAVRAVREEIFGPVLNLVRMADAEGLALANTQVNLASRRASGSPAWLAGPEARNNGKAA